MFKIDEFISSILLESWISSSRVTEQIASVGLLSIFFNSSYIKCFLCFLSGYFVHSREAVST